MTIQSTYSREIKTDESLALTLQCQTCGRFRTFMLHENFILLWARKWSTIQIESECDKCHTKIAVTLGWHKNGPGFSSRTVSTEGDAVHVADNIGLDCGTIEGQHRND